MVRVHVRRVLLAALVVTICFLPGQSLGKGRDSSATQDKKIISEATQSDRRKDDSGTSKVESTDTLSQAAPDLSGEKFSCEGRSPGNHIPENPEDCEHFFICDKEGKATKVACPSTPDQTYYNPDTKSCDTSVDETHCKKIELLETDVVSSPGETGEDNLDSVSEEDTSEVSEEEIERSPLPTKGDDENAIGSEEEDEEVEIIAEEEASIDETKNSGSDNREGKVDKKSDKKKYSKEKSPGTKLGKNKGKDWKSDKRSDKGETELGNSESVENAESEKKETETSSNAETEELGSEETPTSDAGVAAGEKSKTGKSKDEGLKKRQDKNRSKTDKKSSGKVNEQEGKGKNEKRQVKRDQQKGNKKKESKQGKKEKDGKYSKKSDKQNKRDKGKRNGSKNKRTEL